MAAGLPDSYGSDMRSSVRVLAVWLAALLVTGTAAAAAGTGRDDDQRDQLAVGSGGSGGPIPTTPGPVVGIELPVPHELPKRVPSNAETFPAPAPEAPTTTTPPSPPPTLVPTTTQPVLAEPTTPSPPPEIPVGEIPPPYTQAPYVVVDRRDNVFPGADLEVSAPADGGRPGETITVTVRGVWMGAGAGSFLIRGPQRFDRPYEDQPEQVIGQWSRPCTVYSSIESVEQTATFQVPLGPGDEQHHYEVVAYTDQRCDTDNPGPPRMQVGYVQVTFFSRVARPVAPSSPLPTTG